MQRFVCQVTIVMSSVKRRLLEEAVRFTSGRRTLPEEAEVVGIARVIRRVCR